MPTDNIGLRGFSQVLQRPNFGNMFALVQIQRRQQAQEAELEAKKKKEDQDYFDKVFATGTDPNTDLVLNANIGKVTTRTRQLMQDEYLNSQKEGRPVNKTYLGELRSTLDTNRNIVSGYYNSYKEILQGIGQNKDIINADAARKKLHTIKQQFMEFDENGDVSFDPSATAKFQDFFNDGKLYNKQAVFKEYIKNMEVKSVDLFDRSNNTSTQITTPASLYVTETKNINGRPTAVPKRNGNGDFIPNATPESVANFKNLGAVFKNVLERHRGDGGFKDDTEAFADLVKSYGGAKEVISSNYPPSSYGPNTFQASIKAVAQDEPSFSSIPSGPIDYSQPIGVQGLTLSVENAFREQNLKTSMKDDQGVQKNVRVLEFAPDAVSRKYKILVNKFDTNGREVDSPFSIPMTEANLQALMSTEMKPQTRIEVERELSRIKDPKGLGFIYGDEVKVKAAVTRIKNAFKESPTDMSNLNKAEATENVKNIFAEFGIKNIIMTDGTTQPLDIKTDPGNFWGLGKNTLFINGIEINVESAKGDETLSKMLLRNAPTKLSADGPPTKTEPTNKQTNDERIKQLPD